MPTEGWLQIEIKGLKARIARLEAERSAPQVGHDDWPLRPINAVLFLARRGLRATNRSDLPEVAGALAAIDAYREPEPEPLPTAIAAIVRSLRFAADVPGSINAGFEDWMRRLADRLESAFPSEREPMPAAIRGVVEELRSEARESLRLGFHGPAERLTAYADRLESAAPAPATPPPLDREALSKAISAEWNRQTELLGQARLRDVAGEAADAVLRLMEAPLSTAGRTIGSRNGA